MRTTARRQGPVRLVAMTTLMAVALSGCFVRPNDYDGDKKADIVYIVGRSRRRRPGSRTA